MVDCYRGLPTITVTANGLLLHRILSVGGTDLFDYIVDSGALQNVISFFRVVTVTGTIHV
ncbi:MAG: hypothetical protein JO097_16535 [Acidobacteriaceae bacterium]|nr:hypothetical protein [Acidobacteriaceae bacterium]